jgi:hypothetical protein
MVCTCCPRTHEYLGMWDCGIVGYGVQDVVIMNGSLWPWAAQACLHASTRYQLRRSPWELYLVAPSFRAR